MMMVGAAVAANMKKLIFFIAMLITKSAAAFCPVCAGAAACGLVIAKTTGLNMAIVSVWIGAVAAIAGNSLYNWLKKHNGGEPHFPFERPVIIILSLILTSFALFYGQ